MESEITRGTERHRPRAQMCATPVDSDEDGGCGGLEVDQP